MSPAALIAAHFGGATGSTSAWARCRCPVHGGSGLSLALQDGERGLICKCFAGCAPAAVLAELRRLGLVEEVGTASTSPPDLSGNTERHRIAAERDRQRRIAGALELWRESHPLDLIVARYWRSRGLVIPTPPNIRGQRMMRHRESGGRRPVMVALVEHVEHGPVGVHLTYLAIDGSMQATLTPRKRSLGPVGGGAVRLARAAENLLVGEGIETAASVMQATMQPAWAALSTGGLIALVLPPIVRTVVILADNDANGAGEAAARTAAQRWLAEGRRVRIAMPTEPGTDFNDVLLGRAHARSEKVA